MIDPEIEYMRGAADALRGMGNGISLLIDNPDSQHCCRTTLEALRAAISTACLFTELDVERAERANSPE